MEAPVFTRQLSDRECREGRPVKFECAVKGIPRPDVKWYVQMNSHIFFSGHFPMLTFLGKMLWGGIYIILHELQMACYE